MRSRQCTLISAGLKFSELLNDSTRISSDQNQKTQVKFYNGISAESRPIPAHAIPTTQETLDLAKRLTSDLSTASKDKPDACFAYLNWALEMGFWDGCPVNPEDAATFEKGVASRILSLLSTLDPMSFEFRQLVAQLAFIGTEPEDRARIEEEIKELGLDGVLSVGGPFYCLKKGASWCGKHYKEILIGVAATAVAVTIIVITSGAATSAVAAAGCAALDSACNGSDDNRNSQHSTPSATTPQPISSPTTINPTAPPNILEQALGQLPPLPSANENSIIPEIKFAEDGVMMDGKRFSYREFQERLKYEEQFALSMKNHSPSGATGSDPLQTRDPEPAWITRLFDSVTESKVDPDLKNPVFLAGPDRATPQPHPPLADPNTASMLPYETAPIIGNCDQSSLGYFCGINNTVATITEGASRLHKELHEKFAIEPHLVHSDSLVGGLSMVGIEKLDGYVEEHPVASSVASYFLGIPPSLPKLILKNSNTQKAIDYTSEHLMNRAKEILEQNKPNLKQVQVAFSNSSYVMNEALKKLPEDHKNTIILFNIGPTTIIEDGSAFLVFNVIGNKDWASKTCNGGEKGIEAAKQKATVIVIPQNETNGILGGHYFTQPDYQDRTKELIENEIVNKYELY